MGEAAKDQAPRIVELLKDPKGEVRKAAARALGAMGEAAKDQAPRIGKFLKDPDSGVRKAAAEALGAMGEAAKDQVPRLGELLKDPDSGVCWAAARALGAMGKAAKDQVPRLGELLKDPDSGVRKAAAEALGAMGEAAKDQAPRLGELLKDSSPPFFGWVTTRNGIALRNELLKDPRSDVREVAARALGAMGEAAKDQAPCIVELLKDPNPSVRKAAAEALLTMGPFYLDQIFQVLSNSYAVVAMVGEVRFFAHFIGGGKEDVENVLAWLGRPRVDPFEKFVPDHDKAVSILKFFLNIWPLSEPFPALRQDLAHQIAKVVSKISWRTSDIDLLRKHETNLRKIRSTHTIVVQKTIGTVKFQERVSFAVSFAGKFCLVQALFWLFLMFAYPKSSKVQAYLFWNPWMRRLFGLGYVGCLLRWVPFLRARLFTPFKESLRADADLRAFNAEDYFDDSMVKLESFGSCQPVNQAIPKIRGQIVLEGESGIGKTMFLRRLVARSRRVVVYGLVHRKGPLC